MAGQGSSSGACTRCANAKGHSDPRRPDDVRDALAEAAAAEGLSLTGYVRRELEHLARRSQRVRDNAAVVRQTQNQIDAHVDRDLILSTLHDGRGD
jgi:uncharacterized protein (DUF1778 family)